VRLLFGLWFEPEMISPDSELYRAHPDWCLHVEGRERTLGRNQLVLDFSRPEVVGAIYAQVAKILREALLGYVKWEMNRHLTEVGSVAWSAERQGEVSHRHILGGYAFAERLVTEFPGLLVEGCSGGGDRYDPGMLHYTPQFWCSDNTDAIARLCIQHGTSLVYPLCTMGAHVSAVPNHQLHRTTPMKTRGYVALAGQFGFELDLTKLDAADLADAKELTEQAKRTRHLLWHGVLHRLVDPHAGNVAAWVLVAAECEDAVVTVVTVVLALAEPNWRLPALRLRGLDPVASYRCVHGPEGEWRGDALMELGLSAGRTDAGFPELALALEAGGVSLQARSSSRVVSRNLSAVSPRGCRLHAPALRAHVGMLRAGFLLAVRAHAGDPASEEGGDDEQEKEEGDTPPEGVEAGAGAKRGASRGVRGGVVLEGGVWEAEAVVAGFVLVPPAAFVGATVRAGAGRSGDGFAADWAFGGRAHGGSVEPGQRRGGIETDPLLRGGKRVA
jgi:hypothetical protein